MLSLLPNLLHLIVLVAGLVLVLQRGGSANWGRTAAGGLGLMSLAALIQLAVIGSFALGSSYSFYGNGLFGLVNGVGALFGLIGLALVVAALVMGREPAPATGQPGTYGAPPAYGQQGTYGQPTAYGQPAPPTQDGPPHPYGS